MLHESPQESLSALITPSAKLGGVIYAASASRQKDAKKTNGAKKVRAFT